MSLLFKPIGGGSADIIDNFESSIYEDQNDALSDHYGTDLASFSRQQSVVSEGSYALEGTESVQKLIYSTSGLPNYPAAGDIWSVDTQISDSEDQAQIWFGVQSVPSSGLTDDGYMARYSGPNTELQLYLRQGGGWTSLNSSAVTLSTGAWYTFEVDWQSDGTITFTVYDDGGSQVAQTSASDSTFTSGGIGWGFKNGSSTSTNVYWDDAVLAGAGSGGGSTQSFTIRATGEAGTQSDWFDTSGSSISLKHDFLSDTTNGEKVVPADDQTPGTQWTANGGLGITKDDSGVYWIFLRMRTNDDDGGARDFELWKNTSGEGSLANASNWTRVWTVNTTNEVNLNSIQKSDITFENGTYRLYFSWQDGSWQDDGTISTVTASSGSGLESELSSRTNWTDIVTGGVKDCSVMFIDDEYYMTYFDAGGSGQPEPLIRSSTADFNPFSTIQADLASPYLANNPTPDARNAGNILYDTHAGQFVYWGCVRHSSEIYWYWTVSDDLETWTYFDRKNVYTWNDDGNNTARYWDYYQLDDQRGILAMEWDDNNDRAGGTWLWDYSDDAAGSTSSTTHNA